MKELFFGICILIVVVIVSAALLFIWIMAEEKGEKDE